MQDPRTFSDFWTFYVLAHREPLTRLFHSVGTLTGWALLLAAILLRRPWFILAAFVVPYALAWFSHFFVEHNRPATFGHPLWSWLVGALGGTYGYAAWLNDSGEVVGGATNEGDQTFLAFHWKNGKMTNLGTLPGNVCSVSDAINSSGQVVGGSGISGFAFFPACTDSVEHAFLSENGRMIDLNRFVPDSSYLTLNEAVFINDRGEISGTGTLPGGDQHAFLLIPCGQDDDGSCLEAGEELSATGKKSAPIISPATTAVQPNLTRRGMAARFHPRTAWTTTIEPAPTNLTSFAFARGFGDIVRLAWTDHSTDSDSYYVESCTGTTCTNFSQIAKLGANATTDTQSYQFVHGLTFRYRVRAHGPGGYSGYSNIVTRRLP